MVPEGTPAVVARSAYLLLASAPNTAELQKEAGRLAERLVQQPAIEVCQGAMDAAMVPAAHRLAVVGKDSGQLRDKLVNYAQGAPSDVLMGSPAEARAALRIAFLFSGQGAQYPGMGGELYRSSPVFREALDACAEGLAAHMDVPLVALLLESDLRVDQTAYTQPALFALEYALARLWQHWGVQPAVVLGHSVGEYVAATLAGVLSLSDALRLIAVRGRLMQQLPAGGGMLAVLAEASVVREAIQDFADLDMAAFNAPHNNVVAGPLASLVRLQADLTVRGMSARPLTVSHAFHSCLMEPMLQAFAAEASALAYRPATIPLVCNVNASMLQVGQTLSADYFRQHVRQPVLFAQSMARLADYDAFVECGPTAVLLPLASACLPQAAPLWLASLSRKRTAWAQLMQSAAQLYVAGASLNWPHFLGS